MYVHGMGFGTRFTCQNVVPLSHSVSLDCLTSLYKWRDVQPLKGRCLVVYFGTNFHPLSVRKFERGEEFGTQPELPSALCFLGHHCTWQPWGMWLRWPMFSLQVCSFPAGGILVCCGDLLLVQCWPQVLTEACCLVVSHAPSPSDADALKGITSSFLPNISLSGPATTAPTMPPPFLTNQHQKIVLSSAGFRNTCAKLLNMHKISKFLVNNWSW